MSLFGAMRTVALLKESVRKLAMRALHELGIDRR
jgi:hypothetical protein